MTDNPNMPGDVGTSARRLGLIFFGLAGSLIGVASFIAINWWGSCKLQAPPQLNLGAVPALSPSQFSFEVANGDGVRACVLNRATTSCGCVTASVVPLRLSPGEESPVILNLKPGTSDQHVAATVYVEYGDHRLTQTRVTAEVQCPFAGWPDSISFTREGAVLVAAFDSLYKGIIRSGVITTKQGREVQVDVDEAASRLIVIDSLATDDPEKIRLDFGLPDGSTWYGRLHIHKGGSSEEVSRRSDPR